MKKFFILTLLIILGAGTGCGRIAPSEDKLTFDRCGKLSSFEDENWFENLNKKYNEEFLKPQGILKEGDVRGEFGEGCLSVNKNLFVFIPAFSEFGCGIIFKYSIDKNKLEKPALGYCASTFGESTEDYITFTGYQADGGSCTKYNGRYYFEKNKIDMSVTDC